MRECKTYMVVLPNSNSALSDSSMEKIKEVLSDILVEDAFISILPILGNPNNRYLTAIIVLRHSLEEAESVCKLIESELAEIGERTERYVTTLLFGDNISRFLCEL